jgi:hypothetical protein
VKGGKPDVSQSALSLRKYAEVGSELIGSSLSFAAEYPRIVSRSTPLSLCRVPMHRDHLAGAAGDDPLQFPGPPLQRPLLLLVVGIKIVGALDGRHGVIQNDLPMLSQNPDARHVGGDSAPEVVRREGGNLESPQVAISLHRIGRRDAPHRLPGVAPSREDVARVFSDEAFR